MNQAMKDKLAAALGIPPDVQATLDRGSEHPFTCRCETCRQWWQHMGPDDDSYGPFAEEEIEDGTERGNECRKIRLANAERNYYEPDAP